MVTVQVVIAKNGDFIDLTVVKSSNQFDAAALETVARYKCRPATLDAKPVALLIRVELHFAVQ